MENETISEEQLLHNKLNFEINQELIHLMKRIVQLQQENQLLKEKIENRGDFIAEQRKRIEDELVDNIDDDVVLSGILNHMDMVNITIDTQLKTIKLLKQENKELHNKMDKAIEELDRVITFCENDSQGGYDICNMAIRNYKNIRCLLKDSDVDE